MAPTGDSVALSIIHADPVQNAATGTPGIALLVRERPESAPLCNVPLAGFTIYGVAPLFVFMKWQNHPSFDAVSAGNVTFNDVDGAAVLIRNILLMSVERTVKSALFTVVVGRNSALDAFGNVFCNAIFKFRI